MSNPLGAANALFPSEALRIASVAGTDGIIQMITRDSGAKQILKCFERGHEALVEREVGMRKVLQRCTAIEFPEVLDVVVLDEAQYILMEYVDGSLLDQRWRDDPARIPEEMPRFGEMLGIIHAIPVETARQFIAADPSIYTGRQFNEMAAALKPFLTGEEQANLAGCYQRVTDTALEQAVLHGDFAPIQIIVRPDGRWVLFDFEFAMIGPFADDLGSTEVRLERLGYAHTDIFLAGYDRIRPRLSTYEPVRTAFKAYLLLTILSTGITRDDEAPAAKDLERLRQLLAELR